MPKLHTAFIFVCVALLLIVTSAGEEVAGAKAFLTPSTGEFRIDNWTIEEGLPANSVTSVAQTTDGYLWIATGDGLARFDGLRFQVFNEINTPGLNGRKFFRLVATRNGALWIIA